MASWGLIFFSPPPFSPFPGKMAGVLARGQPLFLLGDLPPRRKGFREVAWALDLLGPQPSGQSKDFQELVLVFISIVFQPAAQKDLS